ncbi:hypothetical protein KBC04_04340 [Candidatus Babeliales bacterium]|nr:hypothetical protein [Candidatus Babeliales bacterium]MBP9844295.1 hypothetical protein [Candidatus Babeliales bacterium]
MEHMKRILMIAAVIVIAAVAAFAVKRYFSNEQGEVQIQSFCLGLCGKDKEGNGVGIGIGASERGPMIGAGPWGDKKEYKNKDYNEEIA